MSFQAKKSADGRVEFSGPINEGFSVDGIPLGEGKLALGFKGVTSINSVGVAMFVKFVDSWGGRVVEYHECPEVVVDALQMLPALLGPEDNTARIVSFQWPVACGKKCGKTHRLLQSANLRFAAGGVTTTETCPTCQAPLTLTGGVDVLESLNDSGAFKSMLPVAPAGAAANNSPATPSAKAAETRASQQLLTVMFIDVAGFSLVAEDRLPDDLFRELKPFISYMRKTVREHGGIVDKVLGDGILAYFGYHPDGKPVPDQGQKALDCAVALQRHALELCLSASSKGSAVYPIRIGLNTSQVYVGDLGDDDKAEFTVIGHGVNYAKRIEDSCDIFMIMMSDTTKAAVDKASAGRPGFLRRHINIKHHDRLFDVYEFNPFIDRPDAVNRARKAFQEFQGVFRQEKRRRLRADAPLEVSTDYGPCAIVDFSQGGIQVKLDKYLARGVNLRLMIQATGSDRKAQYLNLIGLSSLNCVVRWGAPGDGGYLHGLKILNLNDEQRKILMTMLSSYLQDEPAA